MQAGRRVKSSIVLTTVNILDVTILTYQARSAHQCIRGKGIHAWHCKPGQKSMILEVIGPEEQPVTVILHNGYIVKLLSRYLFMPIDECCSQPR